VLGAAESRRLADELADEAATTVAGLGHPAAELVALARWVVARDH
jgi:2-keto-4-pentenoate hydratase